MLKDRGLQLPNPKALDSLEFWFVTSSHRLEASFALWEDHASKPSTNVLTPPKLGALREVAGDNRNMAAK